MTALSAREAYEKHCFHGPSFQLLTDIERINDKGVDSTAQASLPATWVNGGTGSAPWIFDPGVVDTLLQTIILWVRLKKNQYPLPSQFGRVVRYGSLTHGTGLGLKTRVVTCNNSQIVVNFQVVDASGRLLMSLENVVGTYSHDLNRLAPGNKKIDENTPPNYSKFVKSA